MASTSSSNKAASNFAWEVYDHDPGGTSATIVTPDGGTTERWADLRDFENFAVLAMSSTLTGNGITLLEIVVADDTASTNLAVVKTSGAVAADAVGDYVFLECTAAEANEVGTTGRYVAARITVANSADEAVVSYLRFGAKRAYDGLTATTIA